MDILNTWKDNENHLSDSNWGQDGLKLFIVTLHNVQVIPNKALENSGRRVPFPINIVCKGLNKEALPPPTDPIELLRLGEIELLE